MTRPTRAHALLWIYGRLLRTELVRNAYEFLLIAVILRWNIDFVPRSLAAGLAVAWAASVGGMTAKTVAHVLRLDAPALACFQVRFAVAIPLAMAFGLANLPLFHRAGASPLALTPFESPAFLACWVYLGFQAQVHRLSGRKLSHWRALLACVTIGLAAELPASAGWILLAGWVLTDIELLLASDHGATVAQRYTRMPAWFASRRVGRPSPAQAWRWRAWRIVTLPLARWGVALAIIAAVAHSVPRTIPTDSGARWTGWALVVLGGLGLWLPLHIAVRASQRLFRSGTHDVAQSVLSPLPAWQGFGWGVVVALASVAGMFALVAAAFVGVWLAVDHGLAGSGRYCFMGFTYLIATLGCAAYGLPRLEDPCCDAWLVRTRRAIATLGLALVTVAWWRWNNAGWVVPGLAAAALVLVVGAAVVFHLMRAAGYRGFSTANQRG